MAVSERERELELTTRRRPMDPPEPHPSRPTPSQRALIVLGPKIVATFIEVYLPIWCVDSAPNALSPPGKLIRPRLLGKQAKDEVGFIYMHDIYLDI